MLVDPYGTRTISSSGSVDESGECGSAAMPLAPPADVQDGTRFALAVMVTGVGAVAEKGIEAGIGAAAPLKVSESV